MSTDPLTGRPFGRLPSRPVRTLPPLPRRLPPRRKAFLSFSHLNQIEANQFISDFGGLSGVFVPKMLGRRADLDAFIDSTDTNYVMQRIRSSYIQDSTVTIVLVGTCTHSRRYIDWEIKASLKQGEDNLPNGLIAIQLLSAENGANLPPRLLQNWSENNQGCYARYWRYPSTAETLRGWIEDAFQARRIRSDLIQNPQAMMSRNGVCQFHRYVH